MKTFFTCLLVPFLVFSCEPKDTLTPKDLVIVYDYIMTDGLISDIKHMVDMEFDIAELGTEENYPEARPTIIHRGVDFYSTPDTLVVEFEEMHYKGKTRNGRIWAIRTKPLFEEGSETTITFEDYTVNGHRVGGTYVITNSGLDKYDNYLFEEVMDLLLTFSFSEEATMSINSDVVRTTIEGGDTPQRLEDDLFEIEGEAYGTHSVGGDYQVKITKPLIASYSCWINEAGCGVIIGGKLKLTPPEGEVRKIDFGEGDSDHCTCVRSITVGGNTYSGAF